MGVVVGVTFPLTGLSMIVVLLVDRYVIRRIPRLRASFGQRPQVQGVA